MLRYLHRNFDLRQVQMVGASAGGLICALAACGVDEDKAVSCTLTTATFNLYRTGPVHWGCLAACGMEKDRLACQQGVMAS